MAAINWREWGEPAFEESRQSGKPVLLSISAVWCHWCHVMDQRSYSDPRVIEMIERDYVAIRADTDREPDINARYNMGGWPSTVFLTSDRDVLTGATYMPPDQMLVVLERVATAYREQNHELMERAREAREETEESFRAASDSQARPADVDKALEMLRSAYDPLNGGFGTSQKFPYPAALELLLFSYETTGNTSDLQMATETLDAMLSGEVFDKVEGGMYRYATRRDWTSPHYEKLLGDNARMAFVLLDAYRIAGTSAYLDAAKGIFSYAESTLMDEATGLFHGSQDADEDYYTAEAEGRKRLSRPKIDQALYTDSNAALARAYVKLYGTAKDLQARDKALRIVSALNQMTRPLPGSPPEKEGVGGIAHYIEDGEPQQFGILTDAVNLVLANLACCEATGDDSYIRFTQELLERMFNDFGAENGAFYDVSDERAKQRSLNRYSTPIDDNSSVAMSFVKLADLTEDEAYRLSAKKVLDAMSDQFENYGIMASGYALALAVLSATPLLVTVHASPGTEEADALIQASLGNCGVNCTVRTVEAEGEEAAASLCLGNVCRIRVSDPTELGQALAEVTSESLIATD